MESDKTEYTLQEAADYLARHGVPYKLSTLKSYVFFGKIPSEKVFSSRVILKVTLDRMIRERRAGAA